MIKDLYKKLLSSDLYKNKKIGSKHIKTLFIIGLVKKMVLVAIIWLIR